MTFPRILRYLKCGQGVKYKSTLSSTTIFDFKVENVIGEEVALERYRRRVPFIVNVASECGLTKKNYSQLAELHNTYHEKGLSILLFPCNQFGSQEPHSNHEINKFVTKLKVECDLFSKINVNGENTHPLYEYLKNADNGLLSDDIKWNFTKFLCNKEGQLVKRYSPIAEPFQCVDDIEKELGK